MVTETLPTLGNRTASDNADGLCAGCPRCIDPSAVWCGLRHPVEYKGLHPVCKICGHCWLRGKHRPGG